MAVCHWGVPKGSRGNNLERHSRGRGRMTKATRTLWLVVLASTTAMPLPECQKCQQKPLVPCGDVYKCEQSRTPTVYHLRHLQQITSQEEGASPLLAGQGEPPFLTCSLCRRLISRSLARRFAGEFAPRFPLDLSSDTVWHRRPRRSLRCRDAPRRSRPQTP